MIVDPAASVISVFLARLQQATGDKHVSLAFVREEEGGGLTMEVRWRRAMRACVTRQSMTGTQLLAGASPFDEAMQSTILRTIGAHLARTA